MYENNQDNLDGESVDTELADLTDALFSGGDMQTSDNARELDTITRQLYQLIAPNTPPDPTFRARLTQRLNDEWALADMQRRQATKSRPSRRLWLIAAVLILVIGVGVVVFFQNGPIPVPGTGIGSGSAGGVLIVLGALAVLTAIVVWRGRR